jgi:hypothetical protein
MAHVIQSSRDHARRLWRFEFSDGIRIELPDSENGSGHCDMQLAKKKYFMELGRRQACAEMGSIVTTSNVTTAASALLGSVKKPARPNEARPERAIDLEN